jgi:RNA:NAD 2'-phosphotransferase (TPT1/KptA family)
VSHAQHIYAEVNTERCAELRSELAELEKLCSYDELRILRVFAKRIGVGRDRYGYFDLARDRRNFSRERAEEAIDWLIYDACDELGRADKEKP